MIDIDEVFSASPVMPVIVLDRVEDAVPLARALVAGGVRVLEVTLRTAAAIDSVLAIRKDVPEAIVGVGTITSADQIDAVMAAGGMFGVSPGTTPNLLTRAREAGLPFLPGTMTPSDVMRAIDAGYTRMKLFPAVPAGGIATLKALAGPFPEVRFCPTGGIDAASAASFLALDNVACVGGSWLCPPAKVAAGDWDTISRLAAAAIQLRKPS